MKTQSITLYGADWCHDCRRVKGFLDKHHIPYVYIDLETALDAAGIVEELNDGYQRIPTLVFGDGSVIVEPSDSELFEKLAIE